MTKKTFVGIMIVDDAILVTTENSSVKSETESSSVPTTQTISTEDESNTYSRVFTAQNWADPNSLRSRAPIQIPDC